MFLGSIAPAILALLTSTGVVISADSHDTQIASGKHDRIAAIGNRAALGAWGPAGLVIRLAGGVSVYYSLPQMVSEVRAQLAKNPPPRAVAEAVQKRLADTFGKLPSLGIWPDVNVLVVGIEPDGKPMAYAVRALLSAKMAPVSVVINAHPLAPGVPNPVGFGITRPQEVDAGWSNIAPKRLVHRDRPYTLAELADVEGLMLQLEGQKNKQIAMPVEQVFIEPGGTVRRRAWTRAE